MDNFCCIPGPSMMMWPPKSLCSAYNFAKNAEGLSVTKFSLASSVSGVSVFCFFDAGSVLMVSSFCSISKLGPGDEFFKEEPTIWVTLPFLRSIPECVCPRTFHSFLSHTMCHAHLHTHPHPKTSTTTAIHINTYISPYAQKILNKRKNSPYMVETSWAKYKILCLRNEFQNISPARYI